MQVTYFNLTMHHPLVSVPLTELEAKLDDLSRNLKDLLMRLACSTYMLV